MKDIAAKAKVYDYETETLRGGCPLCGGNLIGNPRLKYRCQSCNMLFSEEMAKGKK